jgi:hypothetical protein
MAAIGGKGGNDETRVNGLAGGIAGDGGDIVLGGGNGGVGFDFCVSPADGPGGDGGDGGDVRSVDGERSRPGRGGRSGQRGTDGVDGTWEVQANTGLGGDGGDGEASAGSGGTRGGDTDLNRAFAGVMNDPTFEGGADANRCNTGPRLTAPDPNPSTEPDTPVDIEVGYDDLGGDEPDLQNGWLVTELGPQGAVTNPRAVIENGKVVGITFTFTPAPGFEGRATFKVAVKDVLGGESSPVRIDVDVSSVPASEILVITTGSTNAAEGIIRYDMNTRSFLSTVPAPAEAKGLASMPDGTLVAVTATGSVVRFDPGTGTPVSGFGTAGVVNDEAGLFGVAVRDGNILATNPLTGQLLVISPTGTILDRVDVGTGIEAIQVSPDGSKVFIFDRNDPADILDDAFLILDGTTLQVIGEIGAFLLLDMAISPDGSTVVFTSIAGSDPSTGDPVLGFQACELNTSGSIRSPGQAQAVPVCNSITALFEAAFGSGGLFFSPDGQYFYITDPGNGRAMAFLLSTLERVPSADIEGVPVQDFRIVFWTADLLSRVFIGPFSFAIQNLTTGLFGPQVAIPDLVFALLAGVF